ncbi:uncharacterized protein V1513DRAFT_424837 [Lipomyces chichibuensis]|uniref:uncharacterized protein n=1 Tax=Lipomyces chichibuensis TaxID=1546026 RepID=UPI003343A2AE
MNIDRILNSSTAQSEGNDSGQPLTPARDNASSTPNVTPQSPSQQLTQQQQSSPTSRPQYIELPSQEESKFAAPTTSNIPQSQPPLGGGPALLPPQLPQHHQSQQQYQAQQYSYAYQQQYQQQRYQQYTPQSYFQPLRPGYQPSTAQHHIQHIQQQHYQPTELSDQSEAYVTVAANDVSQQHGVRQGGHPFSAPQSLDRNYGESSSMSAWTPPRQPSSSQSIHPENLAPVSDSSAGSLGQGSDSTGLHMTTSDGDPQEESGMFAVKPKRRKAPNSTWTLEEDRKLVDLVLQTLPRQDFGEYAQILNKRDGQTVRYRWKVLVRRAKGENEDVR